MDEQHKKQVVLRTYSNAWRFEKKMYSVGDVTLPFAINLTQFGWFGVGLLLVWVLAQILPFLAAIPAPVLYLAAPFGIMKLLTRVTFHGKPTLAWLKGFFRHLLNPSHIERFEPVKRRTAKAAFTNVVFRH